MSQVSIKNLKIRAAKVSKEEFYLVDMGLVPNLTYNNLAFLKKSFVTT
jgi:hypothetical protein